MRALNRNWALRAAVWTQPLKSFHKNSLVWSTLTFGLENRKECLVRLHKYYPLSDRHPNRQRLKYFIWNTHHIHINIYSIMCRSPLISSVIFCTNKFSPTLSRGCCLSVFSFFSKICLVTVTNSHIPTVKTTIPSRINKQSMCAHITAVSPQHWDKSQLCCRALFAVEKQPKATTLKYNGHHLCGYSAGHKWCKISFDLRYISAFQTEMMFIYI